MFCSKCGAQAASGGKFCGNCGTLLPAIGGGDATNSVAESLARPDDGITRRQMTVLFCDLVGSTSLSERLDAEDLFYALSAYHNMVKRVAMRFHGHVAKIVGDGVDLYFGYPIAGEDDAVRAIHAGLAIVDEIRHLTDSSGQPIDLQVRVGLATGRVTVGMTDSLSIAGTAPNLAARIQAEAKPGQVAIAPSTKRIAGTQFTYDDMGLFTLKGFADEVRISVVASARNPSSRSAWRGRDNMFPMVGRDDELAKLTECWNNAHGRHAVGALLLADAGMGKSRLGTAFSDTLDNESHLTIRLQCSPFHSHNVLYPFVQHMIDASGFSSTDSAIIQVEKLESQLAIAGITAPQDLALMAALLDIRIENRYPPLEMPPPAKLQMTEAVLVQYFMELAKQVPMTTTDAVLAHYLKGSANNKPLLLLVEDLHWIDPSSLELLDKLLMHPQLHHTLIVMTARPSFTHAFNAQADLLTMELKKLSDAAAKQMVVNLCSAIALPDTAVQLILQKTDGIPLYIEEMTRMVQDAQSMPAGGVIGAGGLSVPDTLLDLLMERLDRLGPAKELAQIAAVLGQSFSVDLLAAIAQMDSATFAGHLEKIVSSGLIFKLTDTQLKFKHALIENTAYDSILLKRRSTLHGRAAACLQGDFSEMVRNTPEVLAHHLARANQTLEASRYLLQAGVRSLQNGAPREAAEHLKEGLRVIKDLPSDAAKSESELALLSVLGPTTMVLMGPGSAAFGEVQKRAYQLCHELPNRPRQFPITYGLCLYHWGRAEFEIAKPLAKKLLEDAYKVYAENEEVGQDEAVMAASNMNGMIAFHLGESEAARDHLQRSVDLYQPARDAALYPIYLMDFGVFGRFYLALASAACGQADVAKQHALDALELGTKLNQPHSIGFSLLANMTTAVMRNEPETAMSFAQQCVEFSSQFGFPEFIGMGRIVRGWATAKLGQPEQGLIDFDQGFAMWQMTGFENWQSWFTCLRADVLTMLGQHAQAKIDIEAQLIRIEGNREMQFKAQLLAKLSSLN
jgi:class 3 adenylate cyclase/tetratricopeptide (TPR) repeat protein